MSAPDNFPSPGVFQNVWSLSSEIVFLNHGSFGACPSPVLDHRSEMIRIIESDPMEFLLEKHQSMLECTLSVLEHFTGAEAGSIVMVQNATTGINTVLKNLPLRSGDAVIVSDQEYFSSANALEVTAKEIGVQLIKAELPYPVTTEDSVLDSFARVITPAVKYAMVDHAVSSTGMVLPLKKIVDLLKDSGIETVVDGAHGPGQLPLNLHELGCLAYTGNCHKWLCSPRSAALLYVRPDFQRFFRPLVLSHLPSELDTPLSDYQLYFRWNGTPDPTPELSVPFAIDFMGGLLPGGWDELMASNREKALSARDVLCGSIGVEAPCPASMVGSMAAIPIGKGTISGKKPLHWTDPIQDRLKDEYGIIVPITEIQRGSHRLMRISAQLYNSPGQYAYLADSLREIFTG